MKKVLNFKKIDAFTDGKSSGNPAGYVFLGENENLSETEMLRLAFELKGYVSEVGFARKNGDEFHLKYYSSEREVDFCGHATIAIMYDLLKNNPDLLKKQEVFINVNAGKLSVYNYIEKENAVYIMAPKPEYLRCSLTSEKVCEAFDIGKEKINQDLPIEIVNGGLRTLIVPINTLSDCVGLAPKLEKLKALCKQNEIDIIHVFTKDTYDKKADYRTRVFAPTFGYLEDPATGSGNAAFGYYLIKNDLWSKDILIEQSGNLKNPNYIKLKKRSFEGQNRIIFGGNGTTRIEGKYYLDCSK